ncbi:MAG: prolyl oligopeptidase family serine peptidase [Bacteroidota bacterium]
MTIRLILFSICLPIFLVGFAQKTYIYPEAAKAPSTDHYFGDSIDDPYQWMEDYDDPRLAEWLEEQAKVMRRANRKRTDEMNLRSQLAIMYSKISYKTHEGYVREKGGTQRKYSFRRNARSDRRTADLQYKESHKDNYKTLVKIRAHRTDRRDNPIVTDWVVSEALDLVAVSISHNGSDWREVFFYDLETGDQLADTLKNLRGTSTIIWHSDGVYYDSYQREIEASNSLEVPKGQQLKYHKVGTHSAGDKVLFRNPDRSGVNPFDFTKLGEERLFVTHPLFIRKQLYQAMGSVRLDEANSFLLKDFLVVAGDNQANFNPEIVFGDSVIISTDWEAPNRKVLVANMLQMNVLKEIIPESDLLLTQVNLLGKKKLACIYKKEDQNFVTINGFDGQQEKFLSFPKGKQLKYLYEHDTTQRYTDFCISSFYHPNLWYQISLDDYSIKVGSTVTMPYDYELLETRYVTYRSKDGTEIPMHITCKKDLELNGDNPTLLYGYGGYGTTVKPNFNREHVLWLLHGGVLAVPNVRGGGAEGTIWSEMGRRLNKQNTIDDFIAAAEYLISEKYTRKEKLASNGGSHGGLIVAASALQRPDLFHAVIAEAGVYDMLRFEQYTVGGLNTNLDEFGTVTNPSDYQNLRSYSPLHNISEGIQYPNFLFITGAKDDRVPPHHTYKLLATLQEKGHNEHLYQLYLVPGSGHGGALTSEDWVDKILFKYSYLFNELGMKL